MSTIPQRPSWSQNNAAIRRKPVAAQPLIPNLQHAKVESIEMQNRQPFVDNNTATTIPISSQNQASPWKKSLWSILALIAFSLFFSSILAALIIIRTINRKNNGFHVAPGSVSYSWKFGPTALFVIVIAFWRILDYHMRCQAAWKQMAKGPTPVQKSLLLDYLSPFMPVSVVAALRNRHWDVALSVAVFACMKIAVVFSTGLLALEMTVLESSQAHAQLSLGGQKFDIDAAADKVAISYLGARQRGLPWPASTLPNAAFQELSPCDNSFPANSIVSADVRAFYPSLECQVINMTTHFQLRDGVSDFSHATQLVLSFNFQSNFEEISLPEVPCHPRSETCNAERLVPFFEPINPVRRKGRLLSSDGILITLLLLTSEKDLTSLPLNISQPQNRNQTVLQGSGWTQSVAWSSVLACTANYSIETGRLTAKRAEGNSWANVRMSDPLTHTGAALFNYSSLNLTLDFQRVLDQTSSYVQKVNKNPAVFDHIVNFPGPSLFEMMLFEKSANDIAIFKDVQLMVEPATKVFRGLASAWVGTWLNFPDELTAQANYTYEASRLRVSESPLWFMFAALAVALACILLLFFYQTKEVALVYSGSLARDVITLKKNPSLCRMLAKLEDASDAALEKTLSNKSYHTRVSGNKGWEIFSSGIQTFDTPISNAAGPFSPWTEMAMKMWFTILTLSLALLIIVGLEVVQRESDANSSGLELKVSAEAGQDLVKILPALVMVALALMFTSAEFAAVVTSPYLLMTRKASSIRQLQNDPFRQLPPIAIVTQLRLRHFPVAAIMFAALLGSTLTVIVSDLYTTQSSPFQHTTSMLTVDEFDFTHNINGFEAGSASFTFIQRGNQPFPPGTYEEMAYPLFKLSPTDSTLQRLLSNGSTASMQVLLPVIRPSLNCTTLPQAELLLKADDIGVVITNFSFSTYPTWANVTSVSDLPASCRNAVPAYHDTTKFRIVTIPPLTITEDKVSHIAQVSAPLGADMNQEYRPTSFLDDFNDQYPAGCPSVAFTIGTYTLNQTDTSTTTRLVCSQYFEGIPASMTFLLPRLELDTSRPPILHEDEAYVVSMAAWNFTNIFQYDAGLGSRPVTHDPVEVDLGNFFDVVVNGIGGVPFEQIQGPENVQNLINAVQHVYRLYMAQVIGSDMRIATGTSQVKRANGSISSSYNINITKIGTSFPVSVEDPTRMRIVQNKTPKIILQVVITVMMMCLLFGWRDLHAAGKLLPHNPCTIAGRMSYLAGSRFVQSIHGSTSDQILYKQLSGRSTRLRFGWWENGDLTRFRTREHGKARGYIGVNPDTSMENLVEAQRMGQKIFGIDMVN